MLERIGILVILSHLSTNKESLFILRFLQFAIKIGPNATET